MGLAQEVAVRRVTLRYLDGNFLVRLLSASVTSLKDLAILSNWVPFLRNSLATAAGSAWASASRNSSNSS